MYFGINPDRNRSRNVVFYGRVSTEHESQLSALGNQIQWYNDQLKYHPNWNVVGQYIDEGITGTQAKKRPSFLKMIEDAKAGAFDLIVTREVCRFARNTVDTLSYTRALRNISVEVFFVEDNIWTMDGDGELRLSLMATLAQEESRKVSERVRAGLSVRKKAGVLLGNGNILGYNKVGQTLVINEEQAETVRRIYDLYLQGAGCKKIVNILTTEGRKNASGLVKWDVVNISRILKNATYKGYLGYNKSYTNNYLDQKRFNNFDRDSYEYVQGKYEAIISEEDWDKCDKIRRSRSKTYMGKDGKKHTVGNKESQYVWIRKLRCSCGCHFARYKWRTNKGTGAVFGYSCEGQKRTASVKYLEKQGVNTKDYCNVKSVCEWKLRMMADKIIGDMLNDGETVIMETMKLINRCAKAIPNKQEKPLSESDNERVKKLEGKRESLLECLKNEILTKEEYEKKTAEINKEINAIKSAHIVDEPVVCPENIINTNEISGYLHTLLGTAVNGVSDELIEAFVVKVVPTEDGTFNWIIKLSEDREVQIPCVVVGRKNKATLEVGSSINCCLTYCRAISLRDVILNNPEFALWCSLHHRLLSQRLSNSWLLNNTS